MNTIVLFPADYADKAALYGALSRLLAFPDWFGGNADALHDLLSEREPIRLVLVGAVPEALAADIRKITAVVEDTDGKVEARG